jgi:hypothetical protein
MSASTDKMRELCDLFIAHLLEIMRDPEPTTAQLNVVRQFLFDSKIDFKAGRERVVLESLIESWKEEGVVPFLDPITRKRY